MPADKFLVFGYQSWSINATLRCGVICHSVILIQQLEEIRHLLYVSNTGYVV